MGKESNLNSTQNLVHPDWEIIDPTPDIFSLFPLFDRKFFQGRLSCVQLEWSKKMYNCAGICYQRSNRLGKSCIIRLSEPLLKLRPRKDLIQTLLHEMIHAYCFVLGIREGNGGHGPTFKKIMNGINKIAGTNITVYHNFHDEVDLYKTHWWKCNGPCQHKHPFYGLVKRTTNRKPGSYDFWWQEHQMTCGGEFIKIKEPSPKRKRSNKENLGGSQTPSLPRSQDGKPKSIPSSQRNVISNYFNNSATGGIVPAGGAGGHIASAKKPTYTPGAKPNYGGGTLVIRKPPVTAKPTTVTPKTETPSTSVRKDPVQTPMEGNLRNVKQFKDLSSNDEGPSKPTHKPPIPVFMGTGFTLGTASTSGSAGERRSRLLDKFPEKNLKPSAAKKPRVESKPRVSITPSVSMETILLSDDSDDIFDGIDLAEIEKTAANIKKERQDAIKKEIADSFANDDLDEIMLIDDDYDDELVDEDIPSIGDSMLERSVIDELFNDNDELMEDFNRTNVQVKAEKPDDEIVSCPMCLKKMARTKISDHLEACYSLISGEGCNTSNKPTSSNRTVAIRDEGQQSTSRATPVRKTTAPRKSTVNNDIITAQQQLLRDCGYGDQDIANVLDDIRTQEPPAPSMASLREQVLRDCGYTEADIMRVLDDALSEDALDDDVEIIAVIESCDCPNCGKKVELTSINEHLDQCLMK
uniref:Protein with SprT-like domain at the N terminus n=1 Tax=Anopheles farauti TaxID=69004 RepID=A0A182QW02_9DIPT